MDNSHIEIWNRCLQFIKDNLDSSRTFETWFEPIKAVRLQGSLLTIEVPTEFYYEYLEEVYIDLLRKTLRKELGKDAKLQYVVTMDKGDAATSAQPIKVNIPAKNPVELKNRHIDVSQLPREANTIKNPFIIPGIKNLQIDSQLNPNCNFDNYIEGECNRLARTAGMEVAKNPGHTAFNPLFIFGDSGLGKTHLAQSIGIEVKTRFPKKTVLYVDASTFQTQFTQASIKNERNDFLHFYQMMDVLIIDNVQEFAGKDATQGIFFQIFNFLHQKNKQLVFTSDKPPVELQGLEQRLLSRFKWGLSAEVTRPDTETRLSILQNKIYNDGIELDGEIAEYIAEKINTNVRELEGCLISLLAHATLTRRQITLDLAREVVEKLVKHTHREITIERIQQAVCEFFNIQLEQLKDKTRKREIVQSRQVAMYFAKSLTKASLASIGLKIGGKDHATVLHACKTISNLMETDRRFKLNMDEIEKKIRLM